MKIEFLLISLLFYCSVNTFKPSGYRDAEKYLKMFYKIDIANGNIEQSIKNFQASAGIEANGVLSDEVMAYMNKPRCGVTDDPKISKRYVASNTKWQQGVTYRYYIHLDWLPRTMSISQIRRAISVAFGYWSKASNIGFAESPSTSGCKFSLSFVSKNHNIYDVHNNFTPRPDHSTIDNVPGAVLAHAYFPTNGNVHFDNAETWTEGQKSGINLRLVAAHEIGHALGLGHSSDYTALMAAFYSGYVSEQDFKLPDDDTKGIQSLYGARGKRRLFFKSHKLGKVHSKFCKTKSIDSIFEFSDGKYYVIADGHLFRLNGTKLDESFEPAKADKHFKNVDSMFYDKRGKRLIIFKGQRVLSVFGNDVHNLKTEVLNITGHGAYLGRSSAAFIREESEDKDLQYFWIIQDHKVISGELWKNKVIFGRRTQKLSDIVEVSKGVKLPKTIDAAIIAGKKDKLRLYIFVGNSYYVGLPRGRKESKYFIPAEYPQPYKRILNCGK